MTRLILAFAVLAIGIALIAPFCVLAIWLAVSARMLTTATEAASRGIRLLAQKVEGQHQP